ncbi:gamma-glutamyltransferase family protein [Desulfosediminicola ganghwensis]|uniref:gamma-glutamyltransferase family protein n=1 Tax=Desulfosediminicola ganghwensis TaxID=2569540 RepID=UPI0010AB5D38|nr:gamma-glutamyltransferase [Desulfosediminicola ganghwensis]
MDFQKIEKHERDDCGGHFGRSQHGIVVTAFHEATKAGVSMLEKGGNAVDAACAASMALCVCEPQSSGLGGQGIGMIHINGQTFALDGSSRVPSLAHNQRIQKGERSFGYKSATIPSIPALIGYLHLEYGKLDWDEMLQPAIELASTGYAISELQHTHQVNLLDSFLRSETLSGAKYFLKNGIEPYNVGDLFVQKDLAGVLSILAKEGPRSFYLGKIAQQIEEDMRAHGGLIRRDDLAFIPWPVVRKPILGHYRNVKIFTVPPPAAGRDLLLVLQMLNNAEPDFISTMTPQSARILAETLRHALLQRQQHPIRPEMYRQENDHTMASPSFAADLYNSILSKTGPETTMRNYLNTGNDTTHLSVMDKEGNAVGISQSIESLYGCRAAAEGLGFLYNNYINTLEVKDPSHPYYLRPNATPWSSLAPTIMFMNEKPWLTLGSPGSDRIFSTMAQFIINLIDGNKTLYEAMEQPRLHCSPGGELSLELDRFDKKVIRSLKKTGYQLVKREPYSFYLGAIYAAMRCQTKNEFQGIAEVRREGKVLGPN